MLHFTEGDLLKSKSEVIVHGVAPSDHFDQGLALSLRNEWPSMYKDFRHYCQVENPSAGSCWAWMAPNGQKIIAMFTQGPAETAHGRPQKATLQNLRSSLKHLKHFLEKENVKSLAMPRIGTGVGGLDWAEVKPLLESEFTNSDVHANIYAVYRAGEQAIEKGVCER